MRLLNAFAPLLIVGFVAACGDETRAPPTDTTPSDAAPDTTEDGGSDAIEDVTPDTNADTGVDAEPDTSADAEPDTGADAGPDAGDTTAETWPWPLGAITIPPSDAWKARVSFPSDPFAVAPWSENPQPPWLKFTVMTAAPDRVLYQNGNAQPFHYEFASAHLPPFDGDTPEQFERKTLYHEGKLAILGGLLYAPPIPSDFGEDRRPREVGVQLVAQDPIPTHVALHVLGLVEASLDLSDGGAPPAIFYMPTFEQEPTARADAGRFEAAGYPLSSPSRWTRGDVCYAPGWSIGRLVEVAPAELDAAWRDGRLRHDDILVTAAVPAEIPPVSGVIAYAPSTPLSHVAILATNLKVPFLFAADDATRAAVAARLGQRVALRAREAGWGSGLSGCVVDILPVEGFEGALSPDDLEALLELKRPPAIELAPVAEVGHVAAPTAGLTPADTARYGGKAANFGILVRTLPDNVPAPSLALSADLFRRFLDEIPAGYDQPLRDLIDARLAGFSWPVADMGALSRALAGIRSLVEGTASTFPAADRAAVLAALAPFPPTERIRFRSSSNVEDAAFFTGAGLYDSYSGCLADELDDDEAGPSLCNTSESNERGVFRALKKVYASFWNDNAFLERLRHRVDESRAFMGVLVHPSYPDELELANGVATVTASSGSGRSLVITTQRGAESVTNPSGNAVPEVVTANVYGFGAFKEVQQRSSLVLLGDTVMAWEEDYDTLIDLLIDVTDAWAATLPSGTVFALDFEFKKVVPGRIEVKQVRPLPVASGETTVTPWLLPTPEPVELCVFQGESSTALGIHRAKTRMSLRNRGLRLDSRALSVTFWTDWQVDLQQNGLLHEVHGEPTTFAGFFHEAPELSEFGGGPALDGFEFRPDDGARDGLPFTLETHLPWRVSERDAPLVTLHDGWLYARFTYPRAIYDPEHWDGGMTTEAGARLGPCTYDEPVSDDHTYRESRFEGPDGLVIEAAFWWPPPPTGIVAGYTAPLVKWDRTRISGLTSEPFELRGYWSQTHRPGHHNFSEAFVFEPRLEEEFPPEVLAELDALDVVMVFVASGYELPTIEVMGRDGRWRTLQGDAMAR